jgi:hypothetical protein
MPNNENSTEACFCTMWTAFIINYGASDKTAKGLQDFLGIATKPANMKQTLLFENMTLSA